MISAGVYQNNIIIETDDPSVKALLEYTYEDEIYNMFVKHKTIKKIKGKIYNRKKTQGGHVFFEVGIGWAAYIINMFSAHLPMQEVEEIKKAVYSDFYRTYPFPELYDFQNSDVLHLLKYKFGLYTVYTGYGKTSVIATLANYFYSDLGKKVLLVTPSTKARDELLKRIKKNYGIDVVVGIDGTGNIQSVITQGFLNRKEYKDPPQRALLEKKLSSFDVILCDEVEYCINTSGEYIFSSATGAELRYAFSGTADKSSGSMINFNNGLDDLSVARNKDLIKFFGPSLVYRKPVGKTIDLINIECPSFFKVDLKDLSDNNLYLDAITKIFTNPEICKTIVEVCKKFPLMFIPINNLQGIINWWIDNYFKGTFRVLLVCGEGYIYYPLQGDPRKLKDLQEAWNYIDSGLVDVIPSTSSGFRALDLPNLKNILLFSGNIAGSVLQQIGRVARQDHFNIISLVPSGKKKIPVYSNGLQTRDEMIKEYYKYCQINTVYIHESKISEYNG